MARLDNEDSFGAATAPVVRSTHEIGQVLDSLSIEELDERIAVLRGEIERLEHRRSAKEASRRAANSFFKT